jgi:hypothetical protein
MTIGERKALRIKKLKQDDSDHGPGVDPELAGAIGGGFLIALLPLIVITWIVEKISKIGD